MLRRSAGCRAEEVTRSNTGLHLGVALNYGGKQDVVQAAQRIAQLVADGALSPTDVDESLVASLLQTSALCQEQGPPDLLIRCLSLHSMWLTVAGSLHAALIVLLLLLLRLLRVANETVCAAGPVARCG